MKIISNQGTVVVTQPEKQKEQLPQVVQSVETDLANMVFDSMQDKLKISQLESEFGVELMEIMQLKLGGNV